MKFLDNLKAKLLPGSTHGLDEYTIVDVDEFPEGNSGDVVVVDGVEDSVKEDDD